MTEELNPQTPVDGSPSAEVAPEPTPKENVTVKKDAPPENGGPGFVTLGDRLGQAVKLKVTNIRMPLEELLKIPEAVELAKRVKGKIVILKRSDT